MALNEVWRDADRLSLPVGANVFSGEPIVVGGVGGLVGVAQTDSGDVIGDAGKSNIETSNADGFASCVLKGAFKLRVITTAARAIGVQVFIVIATRKLTDTSNAGANPLFGHLLEAVGAATADPGALVTVRIHQS